LNHHPSRCSIHGSQACHLPPSHLSHHPTRPPPTRATTHQGYQPPGPQIYHLPPQPDTRSTYSQVPNHQNPPTTRCQGHGHQTHQTNYHPNTMVTWSQTCHLPPTTRSTGAKVPRCQSHHHQNIGLPSTRSTDSPYHRSHLATRLTGARATSHRVTDPPLTTRHRATIHTDHQLPRSHGHQPPTTLSTEPPTHLSHMCQWWLSHHPPRISNPPEPPTTKPIGLARLTLPPWYLSHQTTDHQGGKATGASLTNHQPPGARAIDPPTLPTYQTTGATNHHQGVWLTNHQSTGSPEPPSTGVTGSWVTGLPLTTEPLKPPTHWLASHHVCFWITH
jgi:hypothetical protein